LGTDARTCIYCSELKAAAEFSLEHIIPQFMGGNGACGDIVTRDVCRRCNSLTGQFVDAPVARGFFQNSIEHGAWRQCIAFNEAAGNIFPLIYFGRSKELTFGPEEEAEVWLGPEGGSIWHIHTRQPDDYDTLVGGDPVLARKDAASRVYVFNASEHPYWLLSSFKSARAHFTAPPVSSRPRAAFALRSPLHVPKPTSSAACPARCSRSVRNRLGLRPLTRPNSSNAYKTG
jgi:hypothetical protein